MSVAAVPAEDADDAAPAGGRLIENLILGLLIVATLVPVWAFTYFPTTDGGAHVANADVLLQYHRPEAEAYRTYYALSHKPVPNAMGHLVLAGLMSLFAPLTAEKVFVSAYLVLLPLAARYALTAMRKQSSFLAALAVPLGFNYVLHQGFYNFCTSVTVYLFFVGFYIRHRERMNWSRGVAFGVLGVLLYFCHQLSLALGLLTVGFLGGWFTLLDLAAQRRAIEPGACLGRATWPGVRSRCLAAGLALLPAVGLFLKYRVHSPRRVLVLADKQFWLDLIGCATIVSYRFRERYVAFGLALVLAGLAVYVIARKLRRTTAFNRWDGLLLLAGGFALLYFMHGGPEPREYFIPRRLILYSYLALLLWLGGQTYGPPLRRLVPLAPAALGLALVALHWSSYAEFNRQVGEFVAAGRAIEPRTTLLTLSYAPRGYPPAADTGDTVAPFFTAAGYVAAERHAVDLRNYEANTDYFPVAFRPEVNPYRLLATPPAAGSLRIVDFAAYRARTPGRVDYVLVWAPAAATSDPARADTDAQLRRGFDRIATTPRTELWRRKDWGKPTSALVDLQPE